MDLISLIELSLVVTAALIPISVLAHMLVAYRYAPPLAIRRTMEWMGSEEGQKTLSNAAVNHLVPAIQEKIHDFDFSGALEGWLRSDTGKKVVEQVIVTTAEVAKTKIVAAFEGIGGNIQKRVQNAHGSQILDELAAQDLGHPLLNGIWGAIVKSQGPRIVRKIGRVAREKGWIDAEFSEAGDGASTEIVSASADTFVP